MSLMRWLAACRSLKSVEDGPSPYKMTQQNLVPRFGQWRGGGAGPLGIAKRIWGWIREWVFEPWKPIARKAMERCRPARLLQKKRAKAAVQAELVLDTVRVLRNDLREENFVPERKREIFAGPGPREGRAWGRITSRIFGPGQSMR
jgi:hypothetical protein